MTKKEVVKDVGRRVNGGESKRSVYSTYAMTEWETVAVKRLAMLVTLASRKKWRWLNNVLVGLYFAMLAMNVIAVVGFLGCSSLPERFGGVVGGAIGIAVNILILVGLIRFNIISHYALIGLGINGIGKLLKPMSEGDVSAIVALCFVLTSIVLAAILFRKLLPNTSFLLKPKTDVLGCPVFEE